MNEIRKASVEDLPDILKIMQEAREFLAEQGIDQWQGVYPAAENILPDLSKEAAYVVSTDGQISAYFAIIMGDDIMYHTISQGSWRNESTDFVTVHRLAVSQAFRGRGINKLIWDFVFKIGKSRGYTDFRADTHADNKIMQAALLKMGFEKRGLIVYKDEKILTTCIAYQKEF
ncbi:N-acetyltransferase family protein [Lactococcus sp.]|uniref:GNAT family N-acetyltransferase n=1 Tax=Lactococcus sp. TaxID=44273 RepID=UPI0035B0803E